MDFRVRPSSKKSDQSERSLVELPMVRGFQSNQSEMRSVYIRLDNLESSFSNYQDLWRRERDITSASYLEMQKRIDMLQYKTFTNEKDVKQLLNRDNDAQLQLKSEGQYQQMKAFSQGEIMTVKQAMAQEREASREFAKHQAEIIQQLTRRQMRMESEIRELVNKQRQDYDHRLSDQLEEIRTNDNLKQRKMENQYELMKTVIANTQKRIFTQFQRKLRNETVIKDFIEDRLAEMREQMAAQQKGIVSKEGKFIREIKESIQSIFAIIKNTQKELSDELSETQKLSANNLKKLSTTIDMIKEKHTEDMNNLTNQTSNLQTEMAEMKSFVNMKLQENRQIIVEMEEENFSNSRMTKGSREAVAQSEQSMEKVINMEKEINSWRTMTEQKNLNVFKEISSTLRTMKVQWRKENEEILSEVSSFKQSLNNVKKSVPLEIKKSVQAIVAIFNNEFDTLAQELDTITDMIAISKKETEKLMRQDIKKNDQETLKEVKELLRGSSKELTLQFEKNLIKQEESIRSYTDQQVKFIKDLLIQKNASLETELQQVSQSSKKNSLNTNAQLEDFTLKLKTFNENFKDHIEEQRKDDMKKRMDLEEAMRKNANNLMDIYYKKCEFLVDGMKKAIEMNILKDMSTMKRDIEALKEDQNKNVFQTKQDIINQMNEKIDKLNQERETGQETMHEAFDQQINTLRKNLSNEIGNSKLEMGEKINELIQNVNELQQKGNEDLEGTVQSLKEAIWKIEAMSFSQQAKNKAIMDRMGEDIVELSVSLNTMSMELKQKS